MTQPNEYELFADAQKSGQHYTLDGMCACGLPTDDCHFSDELAECELSSVETFHSPLPKTLEPYRDRLSDYNDERTDDNAIFIQYGPGWKSGDDPFLVRHADAEYTVKDALRAIRNAVPCDCAECKRVVAA